MILFSSAKLLEVGQEDVELRDFEKSAPAAVTIALRLSNTRRICASIGSLHELSRRRVERNLT